MRKLYALLLAVVLVFSITGAALAAETDAPLYGALSESDDGLVLTLRAAEETVSGTFTVFYDPEVLTIHGLQVTGKLASQTEGEGFVTLGYATTTGSAIAADEVVATIEFIGKGETLIDVRVDNFNADNDPNLYTPAVTFPEGMTRFKDVARDAWFYDAVEYNAQRDWVNGVGYGLFLPGGTMTRAMFVTILGRMEGIQAGDYPPAAFTDVDQDAYYAPYVAWAAELGITNGMSETSFAPEGLVTREQAVTFLYRYADLKGQDVTADTETMETFADHSNVSNWAAPAMAWATDRSIVIGIGGKLAPRVSMTRAQGATLLQRIDLLLD